MVVKMKELVSLFLQISVDAVRACQLRSSEVRQNVKGDGSSCLVGSTSTLQNKLDVFSGFGEEQATAQVAKVSDFQTTSQCLSLGKSLIANPLATISIEQLPVAPKIEPADFGVGSVDAQFSSPFICPPLGTPLASVLGPWASAPAASYDAAECGLFRTTPYPTPEKPEVPSSPSLSPDTSTVTSSPCTSQADTSPLSSPTAHPCQTRSCCEAQSTSLEQPQPDELHSLVCRVSV